MIEDFYEKIAWVNDTEALFNDYCKQMVFDRSFMLGMAFRSNLRSILRIVSHAALEFDGPMLMTDIPGHRFSFILFTVDEQPVSDIVNITDKLVDFTVMQLYGTKVINDIVFNLFEGERV